MTIHHNGIEIVKQYFPIVYNFQEKKEEEEFGAFCFNLMFYLFYHNSLIYDQRPLTVELKLFTLTWQLCLAFSVIGN